MIKHFILDQPDNTKYDISKLWEFPRKVVSIGLDENTESGEMHISPGGVNGFKKDSQTLELKGVCFAIEPEHAVLQLTERETPYLTIRNTANTAGLCIKRKSREKDRLFEFGIGAESFRLFHGDQIYLGFLAKNALQVGVPYGPLVYRTELVRPTNGSRSRAEGI